MAMNTPRTKPVVRFPAHRSRATQVAHGLNGAYGWELQPPEYQAVLGVIVSRWAHLEEVMILFMELLLSDTWQPPARQIFRSVNSTQARIAIMRSLLEESPGNQTKGPEFDAIISEFESLTNQRNNYVHGLWYTDTKTGVVYRADPSVTHADGPFQTARKIRIEDAQDVANRMQALFGAVVRVRADVLARREEPPQPS